MARKTQTEKVQVGSAEPNHYKWLALAVSVIAAVVAFPEVYWGYNCRHFGRLCENSALPPSPEVLQSNSENISKRLADESASRDIEGIKLTPRTGWFQSPTLDVAIQLKDERTLVVDTMPVAELKNVSTYSRPESKVAMLSFGNVVELTSGRAKSTSAIILYAIGSAIVKRQFVFECVGYKSFNPDIELTNLAYSASENLLSADLLSGCSEVIFQGIERISLEAKTSDEDRFYLKKGDRIELTLDTDFQFKKFSSMSSRAASEKKLAIDNAAKDKFDACAKEIIEKNLGRSSFLFQCEYHDFEGANTALWTTKIKIFEATSGRLISREEFSCHDSLGWESGASGDDSYIVSLCGWSASTSSDPSNAEASLRRRSVTTSIFVSGLAETQTFYIDCTCGLLEVQNFKFDAQSRAVNFEIRTSKEGFHIEGRPVPIIRSDTLKEGDPSILSVQVHFSQVGKFEKHEVVSTIQ